MNSATDKSTRDHLSGEGGLKKRELNVKTGGQWFVRLLQLKGVNFVFGTTGAGMPDIQDAMVVEKPPKWIQGLHEFTTVSAATGYALASGREGVALIDRMVGTQNAIGAVFGAFMNSSPTLIFASANVPGVPIETGAPELHYSIYQPIIVMPWVKWLAQVNSLESMPDDIEKAFFETLSEHQAPVYVTLRQDLMAQTVQKGWTANTSGEPRTSPRVPDDDTVEKIVDEILSNDNPVLVTSVLGRHPEAVNSLIDFANLFGIGVMERRFFMSYPISDRLHQGFLSRYTEPEIPSQTDLVVALEMGLLAHQTFRGQVDVIDITSDPLHRQDVYAGGDYGASLVPATIRAVCDSNPTLRKLIRAGSSRLSGSQKERIHERLAKLGESHDEMIQKWRKKAKQSYEVGKLDNWSIGYVLNKQITDDVSWVNAAASSWETLLKTVEINRPGSYFGNPSGHLGPALGMAYGVALAQRKYVDVTDMGSYKTGKISSSDKVVICTTGDGDAIFGNIDSALWTCAHYGIGVLYVILNNACWAAEWHPIRDSSQHWARDAGDFEFLDVDKPKIDFSSIARGFGVESRTIYNVEEFERELPVAIDLVRKGRPALLDLQLEKFTGATPSTVA
jgi:acetolactate synthase-1/2/3 large subunit